MLPKLCPSRISTMLGRRATFDTDDSGSCCFLVCESVLIQAMPLADFPQDIEAEPGALIEFSVDSDSVGVGRVFEVDDRRVKVEFKHPLIGNNLRFDVEVLAVIEGCT